MKVPTRRMAVKAITPTASLDRRDESIIDAVTKVRTAKYPSALSIGQHRRTGEWVADEHRVLEADPEIRIIRRGDVIAEEIGGGAL